MFKTSTKILLTASLLASQCSSVHAGAPTGQEFEKGLAVIGVGIAAAGIGVGAAGFWGLSKSFEWARNGNGAKKNIGRAVLAATGIAVVFGLGYGMAKIK